MKQVLLTDYDTTLLQSLEITLQDDFKLITLPMHTGLAEFITENPADLILISVSETDSRGFQTCDYIKSIPDLKGTPVVFLVLQGDQETEQRALSSGADDVVTVPFTKGLLVHRMNLCMELYTLRKDRSYVDKYLDAVSLSFAELVECRDTTTGGHLKNTVLYFNILLEELITRGYDKDITPVEDTKDLLRSAALHDIGKIGISDEILRKASPLDYHEYEYMKTHTILGKEAFEKIIRETGGTRWLYLAKDIAYCHHERWDGTGYPNGLKGEEIPIYARLMTIADVYDALTSRRSYKEPFSHQKARDIILEGKGKLFDPELVTIFMEAEGRFEEVLKNKKCSTQLIERE